ncbi:hypothetical protein BDU57DRAFT_525007 [Ampelomyces quisqualis]|uniref:Uncharacterized protein n=1 Tax=Ampelomyces quisqualis TaxID=50730 RepID=A0A6A5Q6J6_AMPQU|nr:hypothetical protein BDU57DRAFT_525007 [Ampelomyces quisqualis]
MKWDDQTAGTIDVVADKLAMDSLEAGNLRNQVRVLQKEMLARVEKCDAIPDEQFAQDFRNLVASIKTLSRTMKFAEKIDLVGILETPLMLCDVDKKHWEGRARKKCMIEAWIWSVLLESIFGSPFGILGIAATNLQEVWYGLFGAGDFHDWPTPSPLCETWRCTTMESIYGGVAVRDIVEQGLAKKEGELTIIEESILKTRHLVSKVIETRLKIISPDNAFKHVPSIVDKAFALAGQISTQRARLQIAYPGVGSKFDKQFMTPRSDANCKDLEDGSVAFIVNPGLIKWGDAHGKNLEHRYDIVPALVQLEGVDEIQVQTGIRENESAKGYADMVKQGM